MKRHHNNGLKKRCGCPRRTWAKCPHPWHLQFFHKGRDHRFSLSRMARTLGEPIPASKTEAKALADRLRGEIRAGRTPVARPVPTPDVSGLTFGDVCDRYLLEYVGEIDTPDGPRWTGQHLRPRTAQQAEYHIGTIRRIPVPAAHGSTIPLEMKPFTNVNTTDIKTVQAARRSHGLVGCNRLMARLRHIFTWSIAEGLTDRSPFTRGGVSLVTLDHRAETERTRRLQPGERTRLLQHAHPHLQALIIAALVALYVGFGAMPLVQAAFLGIKSAVIVIVLAGSIVLSLKRPQKEELEEVAADADVPGATKDPEQK